MLLSIISSKFFDNSKIKIHENLNENELSLLNEYNISTPERELNNFYNYFQTHKYDKKNILFYKNITNRDVNKNSNINSYIKNDLFIIRKGNDEYGNEICNAEFLFDYIKTYNSIKNIKKRNKKLLKIISIIFTSV